MRKTWLIIGLLGIMVLIGGCAGPGTTAQPTPVQTQPGQNQPSSTSEPVEVDIKDFAYVPEIITVPAGTTVVWTNRDSTPHTVTADSFDSGSLSQGQTFSYTFNQAGTFEYRCTIHPSMPHGNVVVT